MFPSELTLSEPPVTPVALIAAVWVMSPPVLSSWIVPPLPLAPPPFPNPPELFMTPLTAMPPLWATTVITPPLPPALPAAAPPPPTAVTFPFRVTPVAAFRNTSPPVAPGLPAAPVVVISPAKPLVMPPVTVLIATAPPLVVTGASIVIVPTDAVKDTTGVTLPMAFFMLRVVAAGPDTARLNAPSVLPEMVSAPSLIPIVASDASVMSPFMSAAPLLCRAPLALTPVPLSVIGSAFRVTLFTRRVAPDATVVPAAVAPKALAFSATSVPAFTFVAPV